MNKIIEFDEQKANTYLSLEPLPRMFKILVKDKGLYYPVNFSSSGSSQIGGNISTMLAALMLLNMV